MWRFRKLLVTFGLFLPAIPLLAARPTHAPAPRLALLEIAPSPDVQVGQRLFEERCATCHGSDATGTAQGPSILGLGSADYDFQLSTGRMPLARPGAQAVRKPPSFDEAQIRDIVAYLTLLSPGGTPIPQVQPGTGDLSRGQAVFELNCAPCHGVAGNGGAVGGQVAPNIHVATTSQIGEAVRIGPGTMPVFDQATISDRDLNSLVRYVLYLRKPEDRGGASLSHGGPIIEGFVALLIGLGSVVLATRFIGARS